MIAPDSIKNLIAKAFFDKEHPSYGQVATVDTKGAPKVRTVHLHYIAEADAIAFNTHTQSHKWRHLEKTPLISGCYHDTFRLIQFRFEAKVELVDPRSEKWKTLMNSMWPLMRKEVRAAYWLDSLKKAVTDKLPANINLDARSFNVGTVICRPYQWHIYELSEKSFALGKSTLHTLENNQWTSKKISLLHY
jgi:pyridoxine/pyridoxamine 5'-phosphate oxidase